MEQQTSSCTLAELQVSYKTSVKASERRKVTTSKDAESVFREIWSDNMQLHEEFYILLLNRANGILGWYKLSQGGLAGTVADAKLIFSIALQGLASGIVFAHSHPSGNLKPSEPDIKLTRQLKLAGEILEIAILDHLILTTEGYFSFADQGML